MPPHKLKIKFSGRIHPEQNPDYWLALFPGGKPEISGCVFNFDPDCTDYDWLVVYEDLMYPLGSNRSTRIERLKCHRDNTLLILQEPTPIKIYGPRYLRQFGHILSAQPQDAIAHPNHIWEMSPIRWFYGKPLTDNTRNYVTIDELSSMSMPNKNRFISTVCSDKRMTKTLDARYKLTEFLNKKLGDTFDWFGRGIRPINDKAEAMNDYRYHLAVENHIYPHYWTEKIADSFLAYCLPIYYGPPNISDYFDPDSYIPIDIFKPGETLAILNKALTDNAFETHLPAIKNAREKVLKEYNLMQIAARIVKERHQTKNSVKNTQRILGRHAFRNQHPLSALLDVAHRAKIKSNTRA